MNKLWTIIYVQQYTYLETFIKESIFIFEINSK